MLARLVALSGVIKLEWLVGVLLCGLVILILVAIGRAESRKEAERREAARREAERREAEKQRRKIERVARFEERKRRAGAAPTVVSNHKRSCPHCEATDAIQLIWSDGEVEVVCSKCDTVYSLTSPPIALDTEAEPGAAPSANASPPIEQRKVLTTWQIGCERCNRSDAVMLIWSDGEVEIACPKCGRYRV